MFVNQDRKGIQDSFREKTKIGDTSETLCRLLYGPDYLRSGLNGFIDNESYLLSNHHSIEANEVEAIDNRILPLVHPDEWETIARVLAFPYNQQGGKFALITINSACIEELSNQPHFLLPHGEYYGKVHSEYVSTVDNYEWELSEEQPNVSAEILKRYEFKFELSIGHKPKLVSSQSPF